MLNRLNIGYKIESNHEISHLLYLDDLKIFMRTEAQLSKALSIVKTFADDISREYSLDRCAIAVMKGGNELESQKIPIDDKTTIQSFNEEETYKYLGIDENDGFQHSEMKEKKAKEYYHKGILSQSAYHFQIRIELYNQVIVFGKCFGILEWRKSEIELFN